MAEKKRKYKKYEYRDAEGNLYARVQVKVDGKYRSIKKRAKNLTHVAQLASEIKTEHEDRGDAYLDARTMTIKQLAEWYKAKYVIEPLYVDGQKVVGLRTWEAERKKIDRICEHLGDLKVDEADEDDFRTYRIKRLRSGVAIATVNRDMETIRRMMRKAIVKKWRKYAIDFSELITKSLERKREMIVSEKEFPLLMAATKNVSAHLHALFCTLYDSGARPSEIYPVNDYRADYETGGDTQFMPLRWRSLFDENGRIVPVSTVTSMKGKTIETRYIAVTERMATALLAHWNSLEHPNLDSLVFPRKDYREWWSTARTEAKMPKLRLRDLRRDWVTRLTKSGYSDRLGQKAAGHKRMQQTFDYTVFDYEAALQAKKILDE